MLAEVKYTAVIIESESGWGQKVDSVEEFDTKEERDEFIKRFNSSNTEKTTPAWYMVAQKGTDKIIPKEEDAVKTNKRSR